MKRFLWIGVAIILGTTGCVHTQVAQESEGPPGRAYYQKILVCSMNSDPGQAAQMESIMAKTLELHGVVVDRCTNLLAQLSEGTSEQVLQKIADGRFDGILVTQRVVADKQPVRLENVLLGPNEQVEMKEPDPELEDPFATTRDFAESYLAKKGRQSHAAARQEVKSSTEELAKERMVHARADMMSLKEDRTIWSTGGIVEGSARHSVKAFMAAFAETIAKGLAAAKLIPD